MECCGLTFELDRHGEYWHPLFQVTPRGGRWVITFRERPHFTVEFLTIEEGAAIEDALVQISAKVTRELEADRDLALQALKNLQGGFDTPALGWKVEGMWQVVLTRSFRSAPITAVGLGQTYKDAERQAVEAIRISLTNVGLWATHLLGILGRVTAWTNSHPK